MDTFSGDRPHARPGTADLMEEFLQLYDTEMARVYRYVRYHVRSEEEAEDITADVFHRALRHWPRMRGQLSSPRAWLLKIASNRLADFYRRRQVRQIFSLFKVGSVASPHTGPEEAAVQQEEVAVLLSKVAQLSARDQAVLALRFAGEMSHREIGQALGISEEASAVALLRALRRLRRAYQGEGQ